MKKLLLVSAILHSAFCMLHSQTKTRVQDSLYLADGGKAQGSLNIAWPAFVTYDGYTVAKSSFNVKLVSGNLVVDLVPTVGATPAGVSYTVTYNLSNSPSYTEYWMVPQTGPVTVAQVRVSPVPTPTVTFGQQQLTLGVGLQTALGFWKRNSAPVATGEGQCYWDGLAHSMMCADASLTFQPMAGGGGSTPDATTSIKGKLKLAGDLGGTADAPTVPGLAGKVGINDPRLPSVLNCANFSGADPGVKISNCLAAGPATYAVYDASGIADDTIASATIVLDKPLRLILPSDYLSAASPMFRSSSAVDVGCASIASPRSSSCTVLSVNPTGDFFEVTAGVFALHDVNLISQTSSAKTAGSGVHLRPGVGATLERLRIEHTWIGVNQAEGGSLVSADNIAFNSTNAQNGAWYAFWVMGGCTGPGTPAALGCLQAQTGGLTDSRLSYIVGSVDSVMQSGAAYIVDSHVDSLRIQHLEGVASGPCLTADCGVVFLVQNSLGASGIIPTGVRCSECIFEGTGSNATSPVVKIAAGRDIRFHGHSGTVGGTACFQLSPETAAAKFIDGVDISEGTISRCGQEGIKIDNPGPSASSPNGLSVSNVRIHGNVIYGASQQNNGNYSAVRVAAGAKRIVIDGNHFDEIGSSSAHPNYFVNIAAGDGDEYQIVHNVFNPTFRTIADIFDGGTGSNKIVGPNVGTSTATTFPGDIMNPATASSGAKTVDDAVLRVTNTSTSSTAGKVKTGLSISSTGTWNGSGATNYGIKLAPATGGTRNWNLWSGHPIGSFSPIVGTGSGWYLDVPNANAFTAFDAGGAAAVIVVNEDTAPNAATGVTVGVQAAAVGSGTSPTIGGILSDAYNNGGTGAGVHGVSAYVENTSGSATEIAAFYASGPVVKLGSSATSTYGLVTAPVNNAGTTATAIGVEIASGVNTGSLSALYGLNIRDQTAGLSNWAIKTGLGDLEFGALAGSGTRFVKANATGVMSAATIANADLPAPTASALGGVQAKTCSGTDKLSAVGTDGVPVCSADQGGGGAAWGGITGTLSNQTDLQSALDARFVRATANTLTNASAPATPAAGSTAVWTDTTHKTLKAKDDAGAVTTTVKPQTCSGTDKLSAIGADGVPVCSADQTGGGGGTWGSITGTLSNQTDLQSALDGKAALVGSGTAGVGPAYVGNASTAARSNHDHRSFASVTWHFAGTPTSGVQNLTLVLPEGIVNPAITDMRVTVNTTSAGSSTFNIQRCTANCTGTSPTFANVYSSALTLSADTRTASKTSAPDQNVSGLAAGDQFKANLVTIGASLADITVTMTYKANTTN